MTDTSSLSNDNRRRCVPIPAGGLKSNEDEARWLEQTILLRTEELLAAADVKAHIAPNGLYDLLLISLNSASKRGRRGAAS